MATHSQEFFNSKKEGKVEIIDYQYLDYALLEDDKIVITETSFYAYLDFPAKDKKFTAFTKLSESTVSYQTQSGDKKTGITVMELIAFCVSLIELDTISRKLSRKAVILLMFFATIGLNQLIDEARNGESDTNEPSFDDVLAGLKRVPPKNK
jgi:hypothetical protein